MSIARGQMSSYAIFHRGGGGGAHVRGGGNVLHSERNVILSLLYIIGLFGYCKGGNFNFHIWAWFGYFNCSRMEIRFYPLVKRLKVA